MTVDVVYMYLIEMDKPNFRTINSFKKEEKELKNPEKESKKPEKINYQNYESFSFQFKILN